jgi:hypothetical protein
MIEDERGPPSIADDIRSQSARPMPKEIHVGELVVVVVVIVILLVWCLVA